MRTGKDRVQVEGVNGVPVTIGGVRVAPGDILRGDADGVVAIPTAHEEAVIAAAEEIHEAEEPHPRRRSRRPAPGRGARPASLPPAANPSGLIAWPCHQDVVERAKAFGSATHPRSRRAASAPCPRRSNRSILTWQMAGPAFTVHCPAGDNLWIHRSLYLAEPGSVLVVYPSGGVEWGYWGDIMTNAAKAAGLAGLVIDGGVRDTAILDRMGFPVFSNGTCIRGTIKDHAGYGGHGQAADDRGHVVIQSGDLDRRRTATAWRPSPPPESTRFWTSRPRARPTRRGRSRVFWQRRADYRHLWLGTGLIVLTAKTRSRRPRPQLGVNRSYRPRRPSPSAQ